MGPLTSPAPRRLGPGDASAYRHVRLRMLKEHPEAYGSSYEDDCALPEEAFARRLGAAQAPEESCVFGVFDAEGEIVATAAVRFDARAKERHRAHIVAVYVAPEWRGQGLAQALMRTCLAEVRRHPLCAIVYLKLTEGNRPARGLYSAFGFATYGVEPDSMRIAGVSYRAELMALPVVSSGQHTEGVATPS